VDPIAKERTLKNPSQPVMRRVRMQRRRRAL
jgi:hypothetical protein